jgi:hypothetical protein
MSCAIGSRIFQVLPCAALTFLLSAEPAHAQRCMQRQQVGQFSFRTQGYALPYQNYLQAQPYGLQPYGGQQSALQQYALQQYAFQAQNALQQNVFQAQLLGADPVAALQAQLAVLQQYTFLQEQTGQLTSSQLRALRQKQKDLKKQIRALQTSAQTASAPSTFD